MDNNITVSEPTRQKLACQGRSLPGKVTGKLKTALDAMVWQAASRKDAAAIAGLTDHSLRQALRRPHVMQRYLSECELLRLSGRAKRLHRLDELASQDSNKQAAVNAIKAAEGIGDDDYAPGRLPQQRMPGITIVIENAPADRKPRPMIELDAVPSHLNGTDGGPDSRR
jgi:hypothetical protein